jgi:hypothetical protein
LNVIAATTNIVATTSAGLTNLLADRVEHDVVRCCFDERYVSQYLHPTHPTATAMKYG